MFASVWNTGYSKDYADIVGIETWCQRALQERLFYAAAELHCLVAAGVGQDQAKLGVFVMA